MALSEPAARCPDVTHSAAAGVEGGEGLGAGGEFGFAQAVQRLCDRAQPLVHVLRFGIEVQQAGDDLAQRLALLQM